MGRGFGLFNLVKAPRFRYGTEIQFVLFPFKRLRARSYHVAPRVAFASARPPTIASAQHASLTGLPSTGNEFGGATPERAAGTTDHFDEMQEAKVDKEQLLKQTAGRVHAHVVENVRDEADALGKTKVEEDQAAMRTASLKTESNNGGNEASSTGGATKDPDGVARPQGSRSGTAAANATAKPDPLARNKQKEADTYSMIGKNMSVPMEGDVPKVPPKPRKD